MPTAAGTPWLVTIRSTINTAIPIRIRSAPIATGITIGRAPSGSELGRSVRAASSFASDCSAHHHEGITNVIVVGNDLRVELPV
jgi:hypothetical protein